MLPNIVNYTLQKNLLQMILNKDFKHFSSENILSIINFAEPLKKEKKLILDLKGKLLDCKINDLNITELKKHLISISNLHHDKTGDIMLIKKLFNDIMFECN